MGDHAPPTSRQPRPLCVGRAPSSWAPLVSPRWQPSSSCCLAIHWPRRGCSRRLHIAWLSPARLGPPSRRPPDCRRLHVVWLSPARLGAPSRRPPDCPPTSPCGNRDFRADVPHRNRDHRAYGAVRHVHSFFPYYNVTDARTACGKRVCSAVLGISHRPLDILQFLFEQHRSAFKTSQLEIGRLDGSK